MSSEPSVSAADADCAVGPLPASIRGGLAAVESFVAAGGTDVVLSPGARSTPLVFALRAAGPALRLHVRSDERSAAFLALGLGIATGRPAALLCTSGSAVANYHPAVLEAHHSGVPLLILSADRPARLRGRGATQTTLQSALFGPSLRLLADLPADDPARVGEAVGHAVAAAMGAAVDPAVDGIGDATATVAATRPGPVQVNVQFTEPLLPPAGVWPDLGAPRPVRARGALQGAAASGRPDEVSRTLATRSTRAHRREAVAHPHDSVGQRNTSVVLDAATPTVVIAGDRTPRWIVDLADRAGWPVIAEPTGAGWTAPTAIPAGHLVLQHRGFAERHAVRRVIAAGHPTLGRAATALLQRTDIAQFCAPDTPEPSDLTGAAVHLGPDTKVTGTPDPSWLGAWRRAGGAAASALDAAFAPGGTAHWSEPGAARAFHDALGAQTPCYIGPSQPVRDLHLYATPGPGAPAMVANRGLAGIDGAISTASGLAFGTGRPAFALLGDLTFFYDGNGMWIPRTEARPDLTVVVINNDGGGIFSLLEAGDPARARHDDGAAFERLFGCAHGADARALCAAFDVPWFGAASIADLHMLLRAGAEPGRGMRVIEARFDRTGLRQIHADLRNIAHAAVEDVLAGDPLSES